MHNSFYTLLEVNTSDILFLRQNVMAPTNLSFLKSTLEMLPKVLVLIYFVSFFKILKSSPVSRLYVQSILIETVVYIILYNILNRLYYTI